MNTNFIKIIMNIVSKSSKVKMVQPPRFSIKTRKTRIKIIERHCKKGGEYLW